MAAPTNFRVEAQSMTTTVLRWTYSGTEDVVVYRSTDGSSYSAGADYITAGTEEYTDEDLSAGTKYWYKLSDDGGSTFSDVETVYTHFCADQNAGKAFMLPRFDDGQQDQSSKLNEMAERVERALGDAVLSPETCYVCPDAGAVVIDCTDGCNSFFVIADQDINSFTINRCGNSDPRIDIYVPPDTTRAICGFPPGYGFGGDECTEAPVSGGSSGRTLSLGGGGAAGGGGGGGGRSKKGKPKTGSTSGSGGGMGGAGGGCECVPGRNNELTLKCCSANCSLGCFGTKRITLKVCGGVGPYTFEHTGSVKFEKFAGGDKVDEVETNRRDANPQVNVVPPTNSGSAVSGDAYQLVIAANNCGHVTGEGIPATNHSCSRSSYIYDCNDANGTSDSSPSGTGGTYVWVDHTCSCSDHEGHPMTGCAGVSTSVSCSVHCSSNNEQCHKNYGAMEDLRTAQMILDGCAPCGLQAGSTVTVTDAAGVSVSITLRA